MKMKYLIATALLSMASVQQIMAWGQKGHDTTCCIAQRHLSEKASAEISNLLDGKSIVYWANWLDDASNTPAYKYSKTWHYKNIEPPETFDNAPLLETGDIVRAINDQIALLKNKDVDRSERILALKMIIHLMGDMHQPLHMGHRSDRGGNDFKVSFFKTPTNLHSLWDTQLVESGHKWSHTEWAEEIDRLSAIEVPEITKGSIEDWARETAVIATTVYEETPTEQSLSYDYISKWTPVIEQQFEKGGLRLAFVLNSIFE